MTESIDVVAIKLLDREYQIKCPPEKLGDLQEAANYLDTKMRETLENSKALNLERVVMIAALNITNELITLKHQKDYLIDNMNLRIQEIQNKIDRALAE